MKWSKCKPTGAPPIPRSAHSTTLVNERLLYTFGGWDGNEELGDLHSFDTTTETWSRVLTRGDKPAPRHFHNACKIHNRLYLFGGYDGGAWRNDVVSLDLGACSGGVWRPANHRVGKRVATAPRWPLWFGADSLPDATCATRTPTRNQPVAQHHHHWRAAWRARECSLLRVWRGQDACFWRLRRPRVLGRPLDFAHRYVVPWLSGCTRRCEHAARHPHTTTRAHRPTCCLCAMCTPGCLVPAQTRT